MTQGIGDIISPTDTIFPLYIPEGGWTKEEYGPARTPDNGNGRGVVVSSSSLRTFRECEQKWFYSYVGRYDSPESKDYNIVGDLYGVGVQCYLRTRSKSKAISAMDQHLEEKYGDYQSTLLPEGRKVLNNYLMMVKRWVMRYSMQYPHDSFDFEVIGGEVPLIVPLNGKRNHLVVMYLDLLIKREGRIGWYEIKTTAGKDRAKFIADKRMDPQIRCYAYGVDWGLKQIQQPAELASILDVLVKPSDWRKFSTKDPLLYQEPLFITDAMKNLWGLHNAKVADRMAETLDEDPFGQKFQWVRDETQCMGMFKSQMCFAYDACLLGDYSRMAKRADSASRDPMMILKGKGENRFGE